MKKVLKQLLQEFSIPLCIATIWTIYVLWSGTEKLSLARVGAVFGPSVFFFSWLVGHFNRVKKQQQTESGLKNIQDRIQGLLLELERSTKNLIGHITGGESHCRVVFDEPLNVRRGSCFITHFGEHDLQEVTMSVTDINEQDRYIHERHNSFNLREFLSLTMHRRIGAVRRGYATTIDPIPFPAPVRDYIRLSIEFSSRNGTIRQWIFIYTGQSEWKKAVKIDRTASDGTTTLLHEDADPGFPLGADGKVNWAKRGYSSSD